MIPKQAKPETEPNLIKQKRRHFSFLLVLPLLVVFLLAGCQLQDQFNAAMSRLAATQSVTGPTLEATEAATSEATIIATAAQTATAVANSTLVLWVPPQFDPNGETPTGKLFNQRLRQFEASFPEYTVEVRLKSENGRGGLLDSLSNASLAAPATLPSLVLLQYRDLESASLKGLIVPLDENTLNVIGQNWLPYAGQLSEIQHNLFGVPFAGDALALVYRPAQTPYPPSTWQELSTQNLPILFPAADPDTLVVINIYQTAGGSLTDENGEPHLDTDPLLKTFSYFSNGAQSGAFPIWDTQLADFSSSWSLYQQQSSGYAIAWASQYLQGQLPGNELTSLPEINGQKITYAQGWLWAIPQGSSQSLEGARHLLDYLSAPEFVDQIDQLAGYLPVYQSGLDAQTNPDLKATLSDLMNSAQPLPAGSTINSISPIMESSTLQIIKQQIDYIQAANAAANQFK
jgi:ABC-type glycerol-3-phosphate transport system substrate-binding protein